MKASSPVAAAAFTEHTGDIGARDHWVFFHHLG